ncbi:MAG TPA: glycosyltransferase family 39 protein [Pyrinomonadaceae bacterium]
MKLHQYLRSRHSALFLILLLSFTIRCLTANFIREHLSDPSWFQSGTYAHFDSKAQNILDGRSSPFWIDDPSQVEAAVYPPGYAMWVALVYKLTGVRSAQSVQQVQWLFDSLSVLLIVGIAVTAFDWRAGIISGFLAALSPLLALYGSTPLADAPTSWIVLAGVWLLLLAVKRQNLFLALIAGALVGFSCWFRSNALILPIFWALALLLAQVVWKKRLFLAGSVVVGALLFLTPLAIRNARAFQVFTPAGLGMGTNLWEGIGETERAAEFGAVYGDQALIERERAELGVSRDTPFTLYHPDGVRRDRERTRRAFAVIRAHPFWYVKVMFRRMIGVLKFAGTPIPFIGSSGINVTSEKSLPANLRGGVLGALVTTLGMVQSVVRYLLLPLIVAGVWFGFKRDRYISFLILVTVGYYLIVGSALHTEIRYGLPMQALLFVFARFGLSELGRRFTQINRDPNAR